MATPNAMPRQGAGLTTVRRERHIHKSCGCCDDFISVRVPAIAGSMQRKPKGISNSLAAALTKAGW